jgi:hypothetical protein
MKIICPSGIIKNRRVDKWNYYAIDEDGCEYGVAYWIRSPSASWPAYFSNMLGVRLTLRRIKAARLILRKRILRTPHVAGATNIDHNLRFKIFLLKIDKVCPQSEKAPVPSRRGPL